MQTGEGRNGFERAAQLSDVPEQGVIGVRLPSGRRVCLARTGEEVFAVADTCTHQEFDMCEGVVHEDGVIECVWHGAMFDLRTGAVRKPPALEPLPVYEVRVEDGAVFVGPVAENGTGSDPGP